MLTLTALLLALAAPAEPAAVVASGAGDDQPVGTLVKLNADGSAELATPAGPVVVRDLVGLRRGGVPRPAFPRGPVLVTTAGDHVPGRVRGGSDEVLRFAPTALDGVWGVRLAAVGVVWFAPPPADTPADPGRYPWLPADRNRDILRFRNGDTATGTVEGFDADAPAVRFKPEAGDVRAVRFEELSAVAFNPALAPSRKPKGPYARLVLRDGTRLAVTGATADADTLTGKTLFGTAVEVPVADLVSLDVMQGKATYLADLKPKRVEQAAFLGPAWPWAADRTARGTPFRLRTAAGEETFDRGLGTHPHTILTYDLGGKYRRFEALVGLDAATGDTGRATVRVLVDGKEQALPALQKLAAGPAVAVRLDVTGAKELTLAVEYGPAADVRADVDWADARLVE